MSMTKGSGVRCQVSGDEGSPVARSRFTVHGSRFNGFAIPPCRFRFPASHSRHSRRGFTLVEVCLALMVVSIGVLGAFALFPHGLAEARLASAETQAGLFSEMVLRTYRAASTVIPWNTLNSYQAPVPGADSVWNGSATTSTLIPGSSYRSYVNAVTLPGGGGDLEEIALRYKLVIDDLVPGRLKRMTLYVLLGRFGITQDDYARVYVSYIYNQQ